MRTKHKHEHAEHVKTKFHLLDPPLVFDVSVGARHDEVAISEENFDQEEVMDFSDDDDSGQDFSDMSDETYDALR